MRPNGTIAGTVALAAVGLVSGAAVAQAQTSITRQITSEPVETVITQGPNGTAVTRRILSPEPGIRTYAPAPLAYSPVATEVVEQDYVAPAAPPPRPRRTTTTTAATTAHTVGQAPAHTHTATAHQRPRPARTVTRNVTAPVSDQALVLSPAQRRIIYRSVVEPEYYPAPVPAAPPLVAPTEFYSPPPFVSGYPADVDRDYAYDPYHDEYRETYRYRWSGVPPAVGARIPPSVPLYAVPQPVVASIPAAAPYSYALIENRVFLVDPVTDVIVAEITP